MTYPKNGNISKVYLWVISRIKPFPTYELFIDLHWEIRISKIIFFSLIVSDELVIGYIKTTTRLRDGWMCCAISRTLRCAELQSFPPMQQSCTKLFYLSRDFFTWRGVVCLFKEFRIPIQEENNVIYFEKWENLIFVYLKFHFLMSLNISQCFVVCLFSDEKIPANFSPSRRSSKPLDWTILTRKIVTPPAKRTWQGLNK